MTRVLAPVVVALLLAGCPKKTPNEPAPQKVTDPPTTTTAPPAPAPAPPASEGEADAGPTHTFIFNRVIVKPKQETDKETLSSKITAHTGEAIKEVIAGALGTYLIVFDDVEPPRDAQAQAELVKSLQEMSDLEYANPDRIMNAR